MKYLKKFLLTENIDINELQNFCNDNLAFLIDEGFEVKVIDNGERVGHTYIVIRKQNKIEYLPFNWLDYKEDIIQFILYLYEKYNFDDNMNIIDKHGGSEFIKISKSKLGFYKKSEVRIEYLERLKIDYPITQIYFSKSK